MVEKNVEIDVTRFVNIDDKAYDIYIGGKLVRHLEPSEEQHVPLYVAQVGAKHLVDRILQEKHNIKDTNRDTPIRKDLFAKIIPDLAKELEIKPLSKEEQENEIAKQLKKQEDELKTFREARIEDAKKEEEKDKKIADLEKMVKELASAVKEKKETKVAKKSA